MKLRGGRVGVATKLLAAKSTSLLRPERKGGGSQEARAARWCQEGGGRQKDLASLRSRRGVAESWVQSKAGNQLWHLQGTPS